MANVIHIKEKVPNKWRSTLLIDDNEMLGVSEYKVEEDAQGEKEIILRIPINGEPFAVKHRDGCVQCNLVKKTLEENEENAEVISSYRHDQEVRQLKLRQAIKQRCFWRWMELKHPYFPLGLSIIALAVSAATLILRVLFWA